MRKMKEVTEKFFSQSYTALKNSENIATVTYNESPKAINLWNISKTRLRGVLNSVNNCQWCEKVFWYLEVLWPRQMLGSIVRKVQTERKIN